MAKEVVKDQEEKNPTGARNSYNFYKLCNKHHGQSNCSASKKHHNCPA